MNVLFIVELCLVIKELSMYTVKLRYERLETLPVVIVIQPPFYLTVNKRKKKGKISNRYIN